MANRKLRPCVVEGCSFCTTADSGVCATHRLVDPRLLAVQMDELTWCKVNAHKRGAWSSAQNRLYATKTAVTPLPTVEVVSEAPAWQSNAPAGICELPCDDAVTAHPWRHDLFDIARLLGIGAVLFLLWLACECVR